MENISPKEWLISVAVLFVTLALAIFVFPFVRDGMLKDLRNYQNALEITDPVQFVYAKQTGIGNVLAFGTLSADQPQTFPELLGRYAIVKKVQEQYNMHTYITTSCSGSGESEVCTTQTHIYYSWDYDGEQDLYSPTYHFLGQQFNQNDLQLDVLGYIGLSKDTLQGSWLSKSSGIYLYGSDSSWVAVGDLRWYYKVRPIETQGTLYAQFFANQPQKRMPFYNNQNPQQIIQDRKQLMNVYTFLYYAAWIVVIVGGYLFWAYEYADIE